MRLHSASGMTFGRVIAKHNFFLLAKSYVPQESLTFSISEHSSCLPWAGFRWRPILGGGGDGGKVVDARSLELYIYI